MKKNNIILSSVFVVLFSLTSFSQGGGVWNFDWNIGFGLGETGEFISNPSGRGFSIDGRGFVTDNITVGGIVGWNTFYQNEGFVTEDYESGVTVNGYKRKYINVLPIMVNTHYYLAQTTVMPYIGFGVGATYAERRDYMGIYYVEESAWHFSVAPELGIVYPFGSSNTGINANVKYNYAAKTKDTKAVSFLSVNIGISYVF
ncbi:MAG: hypothetical protein C0598_07510 [Marinilabiliales bacterium]|nr:MAG: hypothetical protein C0598_07510 [Marinilabiliales bacterium]